MYNHPVKMSKDNKASHVLDNHFAGVLHTVNAFGDDVENLKELNDLLSGKRKECHHHPLTGALVFENAKKGDYLKVQIHNIKIDKMAQCLSKSAGVNPIDVNHFGDRSAIFSKYDQNSDTIAYCHGINIPYKPMLGIIGTAMEEEMRTGHAGRSGGNLDLPSVTNGSVIYLPVFVDGAYFYIGDAHANQAYGELGGIALEASAEVELTIDVISPSNPEMQEIFIIGKEPFSEKNTLGIVGVGDNVDDIDSGIKNCFSNAISVMNYLMPEFNKTTISNFLTIIGHLMLGQAYSKTAETTAVINILEKDLSHILNRKNFSIYELEDILFKQKKCS